jgi:hypothetical protein
MKDRMDTRLSPRWRRCGVLAALAVALLAWPVAAQASLRPAYVFAGPGGYSADAVGSMSPPGTLQAEIPPGSRVEQAFVYVQYYSLTEAPPPAESLTITFDGRAVVTRTLPHTHPGLFGFATSRADVTDQVAAKARVNGIASFTAGYDTAFADGVALVVVYSNPALLRQRITVLDGGANPSGDRTVVALGSDVDPRMNEFAARLSLGIGFSAGAPGSHDCGAQSSTVDVNGRRLASCAGGTDDGEDSDGSLITVGGVGDSIANPAGTGPDDELYDVSAFIAPGDTALTLDTLDPVPTNDSIFLGVLSTTLRDDSDGDGIDRLRDNCPDAANPDQADRDADGTGDVCDADRDGDATENPADNCADVANAEQRDSDRDGIGDACDPTPFPPPPGPRDTDADGVPDSADNCPERANSDQADGDDDRVGDACELLPPGNVAPVAGVTTVVKLVAGEVFVKLPKQAPAAMSSLRSPLQQSDFVPLKGVASVPIGSQVDARRGTLSLETAANVSARTRRQRATLRAGMFAVRQARARPRARKSAVIPTDIALISPPGAEAACARSRGARPGRRVVRGVSMVLKGLYRAVAGASVATATNAVFNTTDRCDGTLTEVGRGRVSVAVKGTRKPVIVKGGRAYLAKARLFAARQGVRRPRR